MLTIELFIKNACRRNFHISQMAVQKKYIYGGPSVGVNKKINKTFRFGAINPFNKHVTSSLFI